MPRPSDAVLGRIALTFDIPFRVAFALLLGALTGVGPTTAAAQIQVSTGYTPDPVTVTGETVGAAPINRRAAGCRGYVGESPDAVLDLSSPFGFLRFFVVADAPVTLAIRDREGEWHCSGRPLDGAPREEGRFAPGRVEVWIGSAEADAQVSYELRVTEFHSVTPATGSIEDAAPVGGGAELGLLVAARDGVHRDRRLRRGFLPDPRMDNGASGGAIDARRLGGRCVGYVSEAPGHVLTLRDDFDYFRIQLGEVPGDATLIVRSPGGRWFCNAASDINARVERDAWPAGDYRIWVGARAPESTRSYRICYTEARPHEGRTLCGDPALNVPRTPEPEAGEPEAGEPEAGEPEAGEPEASEPEAGEPEAGEPEAAPAE